MKVSEVLIPSVTILQALPVVIDQPAHPNATVRT